MNSRLPPPAKIEYDGKYVLRPVEPNDVSQIEKARADSLPELHRFMEWSHTHADRSQILQRVITQWINYFRGDEYEMALFDKESGEFLVYTGFYPSLRQNPLCYEIGYWTHSHHRGKGFATLATQLQIALIFEYFKGDRIEISCSPSNESSLRVIEKCGFQQEGRLRNFLPRGNDQMYASGYIHDRTALLFSLIPPDCEKLDWYHDVVKKITVYPLIDPPFELGNR